MEHLLKRCLEPNPVAEKLHEVLGAAGVNSSRSREDTGDIEMLGDIIWIYGDTIGRSLDIAKIGKM